MLTAVRRKLFTVEDFHAMDRAGIFGEDDRVELIEGEIVHMAAIGSCHQAIVDRFTRLLVPPLGERAIVRVQGPVRLARITEPQPDLQLLAPRDDFYAAADPSQADALLVVEVADTTLRFDCDEKSGVYARRGVRELWDRRCDRRLYPGDARPGDLGIPRGDHGFAGRVARPAGVSRPDGKRRRAAGTGLD